MSGFAQSGSADCLEFYTALHCNRENATIEILIFGRRDMKRKAVLKISLVMFILTIVLQVCARNISGFGEWYAVTVYPLFLTTVSRCFSILPFSAAEVLLYGLLISGIVLFVRGIVLCLKKKLTLTGFFKISGTVTAFVLSFALFGFTITCGMNYHRIPFSAREGWEIKPVAIEELEALCRYLGEEVSKESARVQRNEQGITSVANIPLRKGIRCLYAGTGKEI